MTETPENIEREAPGAWIEAGEIEFHEMIRERLRASGNIGDVFPMMVAHNVPHFVLHRLWPEQYATFRARPWWAAFTVAETGWKGSIDNLKSRLEDPQDGREGVTANFSKSYVVTCDGMLMLLRRRAGFALALVPRSDGPQGGSQAGEQTWTRREEASVSMCDSRGFRIDHFLVEGRTTVLPGDYLELSRKAYARLGLQIPRRELTSLALLAEPLLQYHGTAPDPTLREHSAAVLQGRGMDKISREDLQAAGTVIDAFFQQCERAKIQLHPFWENARKMRTFLVK